MNSYKTKGIILKRVEYGEADRIVTFITPDQGRVSAIAKGVRKPKSKLAGGIELFSVSDLTVLKGRRDLDTLMSTKIVKMYRDILTDYDRLEVGYRAIELIAKATEEEAKEVHFELLKLTFELLDNTKYSFSVIELWFYLQLSSLEGFLPELVYDSEGEKLSENSHYTFSSSEGVFKQTRSGNFSSKEIKAWRILSKSDPNKIGVIKGLHDAAKDTAVDMHTFMQYHMS